MIIGGDGQDYPEPSLAPPSLSPRELEVLVHAEIKLGNSPRPRMGRAG